MKGRKQRPKAKPKCNRLRRVAKAATERALQQGQDPKLAKRAEIIRTLGKRVITDIIEIGRQLTLAKDEVGHGHWADWLKKEFDWSEGTALNFMRVYELVEDRKSKNFMNLRIAPSALYALARPNTPDEVRDEIIERAEAGESITNKDVQEALQPNADVKQEAPTAAAPANNVQEASLPTSPLPAEDEDDDEEETSKDVWVGRKMICANKAAGEARIEDWSAFELPDGVVEAVRATAEAWRKLIEYLEQRRGSSSLH
jgi:DUF3102 family protein